MSEEMKEYLAARRKLGFSDTYCAEYENGSVEGSFDWQTFGCSMAPLDGLTGPYWEGYRARQDFLKNSNRQEAVRGGWGQNELADYADV